MLTPLEDVSLDVVTEQKHNWFGFAIGCFIPNIMVFDWFEVYPHTL